MTALSRTQAVGWLVIHYYHAEPPEDDDGTDSGAPQAVPDCVLEEWKRRDWVRVMPCDDPEHAECCGQIALTARGVYVVKRYSEAWGIEFVEGEE